MTPQRKLQRIALILSCVSIVLTIEVVALLELRSELNDHARAVSDGLEPPTTPSTAPAP